MRSHRRGGGAPGVLSDRGSFLPNVALGAGLVLANHELGRLTVRRLSTPITLDIVKSDMEIPYQLNGARAQLRVRTDALVLRMSRTEHVAILMPDLRDVAVEDVPTPTSWQPRPATTLDVPEGTALRVSTENKAWLLPVADKDGEVLVAAIQLRADRHRSASGPPGEQPDDVPVGSATAWPTPAERRRDARSGRRRAEPLTELRKGPGLGLRWLMATPLICVVLVLPTFGQAAVQAWRDVNQGADAGFWHLVSTKLQGHGLLTFVISLFVLFGFLVARLTHFAAWPRACLVLGILAIFTAIAAQKQMSLPGVGVGICLAGINYGLGKLTVLCMTRPIAVDIAESPVDIPYRLPGVATRLRVQEERLRLELPRAVFATMPLKDLRGVTFEWLREHLTWQPTPAVTMDVPPGPVVRLYWADREWLLPVNEADGEALSIAIVLRAWHEGNEQIR